MDKGKKILVTGGCGYIGSHTIVDLLEHGYEVICVDNLSNSNYNVLYRIEKITNKKVQFLNADLSNQHIAAEVLSELDDIDGIIHFAALKSVSESVQFPLTYYTNNINSLIFMIEWAKLKRVKQFIFSSSCSVYGNAKELPVTEMTPFSQPESPYASTKQIGETIIRDYSLVNQDIQFLLLRYFNPAGAHPSGLIGEDPINIASNLVPVITEFAAGERDKLMVFGTDYQTRDGSCVRDFIHVVDIARAHTLSFEYLEQRTDAESIEVFNLGIGEGVTVLEAIHAFERVSGLKLNYIKASRRPGDVESIFADSVKARQVLNWNPEFGIEEIMQTAWKWQQNKKGV
jgi:UDP-glucose 4-epimerase